jgi:DNA-binding SARP family transcriptional activator/thioredoxin-like negative regulator of GroEL
MPVLHLFGSPTLENDDGQPIGGRASQRHRLALLALLARTRGGLTRDKLVALLWPESSTERARSSLNESIYVLRRALGDDAILSTGEDLRLGAAALTVDVTTFEESLARGDAAQAVETYRGPFLDGFFLSRAGEFERWSAAERDSLADSFRGALDTLAADADRRGDAPGAARLWRRLATEVPLDARIATRLMTSLVAAGDRAGALEHARIHAALAAQELGLAPDAEVAALAQRIREGRTPNVQRALEPSPQPTTLPNERSGGAEPTGPSSVAHRPSPARTRRRVVLAAASIVMIGVAALIATRDWLPAGSHAALALDPAGLHVSRPPGSALPAPSVVAAATSIYVRGRAHLAHHREAELRAAIAAFDSAIALDQRLARAHASLAIAASEMHLRFAGVDEAPAWGQRAVSEARVALELDSTLAEAHVALAAVHRKSEFDWEATIAESRRALQLDSTASEAWFYMAGALYHLGLLPEAERAVHAGLDADPQADRVEALRTLATVALGAGRYTEAATLLQDVQRLSDRPVSDTHLATAYFYAGERTRAERLLEPLLTSRSASAATRARATLASFAASRGENARARALVEQAQRGMVDHHAAYGIGVTYAQMGDAPAAVRWLRTAAETGFRCYPWYTRDPLLAPIQSDPAFQVLVAELKRGWERDRVRFGQ